MSNNVYPKGVSFFPKKPNAPSWVIGSLIITPRQFIDWIKENPDFLTDSDKYGKQLKLTLTEKGVQVDTYKPEKKQDKPKSMGYGENDDSLPF